jgi:general secretion pathway protein K
VKRVRRRADEGFALIAVLLVMALVGVLGAEFAYSMRLEATSVRAYKEGVIATHLAEAGIEQAIRETFGEGQYVTTGEDGCLNFYRQDRLAMKRLPNKDVPLGAGTFSYCITDESSRININTVAPDQLDRLLQDAGLKKTERDTIIDSLQDWRDPNEEHRLNGAESEDHYLKLSVPYRSRNGGLLSINELLQIKGVTPKIFYGEEGKPGLVDLFTVHTGRSAVNINTASRAVLTAMGMSPAEILEVEATRLDGPFTGSTPGRFGGRRLGTLSRTFRIEAQGSVGGQVRARLRAIIQRRGEGGTPAVVVMEWLTIQ